MILRLGAEVAGLEAGLGAVENVGQIQPLSLPVRNRLFGLQQVGVTDHLVEGAEAQLCHQLAYFLSHKAHEVDYILWLAGKALTQFRILGGNSGRACVAMAYPHHHAAQGNQRCGGEAELLGTQQCSDHNIATGLELTVNLNDYPAAQVIKHQGLMGFGQAELPGQTGMLDAGERRCAGTAIIPADQDDIGMGLGNPGCDGADSDL